jgi:hypothetical protein
MSGLKSIHVTMSKDHFLINFNYILRYNIFRRGRTRTYIKCSQNSHANHCTTHPNINYYNVY